jgi:hypothetical protein
MTATQPLPKAFRRPVGPEEKKYRQLWRAACIAQGWKQSDRDRRMAVHVCLFGSPISSTEFKHHHFDRTIALFRLLANSVNLDAAIATVQYENHDAAQARHRPVIQPGQTFPDRDYASKYEKETRVDDPGERKRCVYKISRLFAPALVDQVKRDIIQTARPWDDLDLPDLILLRDRLNSYLGTWLTKAKREPDAAKLVGIPVRGDDGLVLSNKELIKRLLKRGIPVAITGRKASKHPR